MKSPRLVARRIKRRAELWRAGSSASTPKIWMKFPALHPNDKVCLFVTVLADGEIPQRATAHASAWASSGYKVVLVMVVDNLDEAPGWSAIESFSGAVVRLNRGYDFAAWSAAISALPNLRRCERLLTVNDSVFGPSDRFLPFVELFESAPEDVVGAVGSNEVRPHFQSFMVMFSNRALNSQVFWAFWLGIKNGDRQFAINHYELEMTDRLRLGGLTSSALFPPPDGYSGNMTMSEKWSDLCLGGFPFVKKRLLGDVYGSGQQRRWVNHLKELGFNTRIVEKDLDWVGPSSD